VIAEGVETAEQLSFLKHQECERDARLLLQQTTNAPAKKLTVYWHLAMRWIVSGHTNRIKERCEGVRLCLADLAHFLSVHSLYTQFVKVEGATINVALLPCAAQPCSVTLLNRLFSKFLAADFGNFCFI